MWKKFNEKSFYLVNKRKKSLKCNLRRNCILFDSTCREIKETNHVGVYVLPATTSAAAAGKQMNVLLAYTKSFQSCDVDLCFHVAICKVLSHACDFLCTLFVVRLLVGCWVMFAIEKLLFFKQITWKITPFPVLSFSCSAFVFSYYVIYIFPTAL